MKSTKTVRKDSGDERVGTYIVSIDRKVTAYRLEALFFKKTCQAVYGNDLPMSLSVYHPYSRGSLVA